MAQRHFFLHFKGISEIPGYRHARCNFTRLAPSRATANAFRFILSIRHPELDQVMAQVEEALGDAQITAQEVDHVVLTGGSCLIPDFRKRVTHLFPQQTIIEADVSSAVVEGLAAHAREIDWR